LGSLLSDIKINVKIASNNGYENFPKMHCLGSFLSNIKMEQKRTGIKIPIGAKSIGKE